MTKQVFYIENSMPKPGHSLLFTNLLWLFVSQKLKDLEFHYRQKVLKQINKGINGIQVEEPRVKKLPFSQIFMFIEDRKRDIEEATYSLRSQSKESKFIESLFNLNMECYDYFFSQK